MLLTACGTTRYGEKVTQSQYEFSSYSIAAPKGDWGVVRLDEAAEGIRFGLTHTGTIGRKVQITVMEVSKIPVTASGAELAEEALADDQLATEERNVAEEGRKTKVFSLKNVRKGSKTVGGKKVYFLQYEVDYSTWEVGAKAGESLLYVYFPPDWKTRRAFYSFEITETWRTGGTFGVSRDLSPIESLVASFATR